MRYEEKQRLKHEIDSCSVMNTRWKMIRSSHVIQAVIYLKKNYGLSAVHAFDIIQKRMKPKFQ